MPIKQEEINHIVTGQQVNYQGLFNYRELMKLIDQWLKKNGYIKVIMGDKESVYKTGRSINLRMRPYKPIKTNKYEIQLWINITNMTEVIKKVDGYKTRMDRGKVNIVLDAFFIDSVRGKWESRAEYFMIRAIFDKFLMTPKSKNHDGKLKAELMDLKEEINSFLNLNKFLY